MQSSHASKDLLDPYGSYCLGNNLRFCPVRHYVRTFDKKMLNTQINNFYAVLTKNMHTTAGIK